MSKIQPTVKQFAEALRNEHFFTKADKTYLEARIGDLDTDCNGRVSKEELASWIKTSGWQPSPNRHFKPNEKFATSDEFQKSVLESSVYETADRKNWPAQRILGYIDWVQESVAKLETDGEKFDYLRHEIAGRLIYRSSYDDTRQALESWANALTLGPTRYTSLAEALQGLEKARKNVENELNSVEIDGNCRVSPKAAGPSLQQTGSEN